MQSRVTSKWCGRPELSDIGRELGSIGFDILCGGWVMGDVGVGTERDEKMEWKTRCGVGGAAAGANDDCWQSLCRLGIAVLRDAG